MVRNIHVKNIGNLTTNSTQYLFRTVVII